ncbi:SBBP repeat beta-propeller lipoprotein, LipL53 family [Leptospira santarosai]|uniref:SBBP repeat beta-propeller lipoprotein, LipL53 family n=1 Tax=Leptospira santarosai TaxID=28183 RepID=UPI000773FC43|nr:SBBP repeat-containing protein [Leptospira santarosai]
MIQFLILFFIFLFQACSPTSDAKTNNFFLLPLAQGNNIGPVAVHGNLDSLDAEEAPLRENSVSLEWASLYSGGPDKLTRDSKLAVDEQGFIYVAADTDSDPYYNEISGNWILKGKNLILVKYDSQKNKIWERSILGVMGTVVNVTGIAVDPKGNTYVTGSIIGSLERIPMFENRDMFVIKFDSEGIVKWIKQLGLGDKKYEISPGKIAVDTFGNSYIVGTSNGPFGGDNIGRGNGFIIKFDTDGNQIWIEQLSIPGANIVPTAVAFDKVTGSIYMSGFGNANFATNTTPGIGQKDLFILKYDSEGNRQFFAQLGAPLKSVCANAITVDRFGNVLVGGYSNADFGSKPDETSYVGTIAKYDSSGVRQWVKQFGSPTNLKSTTIIEMTTDRIGNVFTTGQTTGLIKFADNTPSEGDYDVFVTKHSPSGETKRVWQWGTVLETMVGSGIGVDFDGNLYTTGWATTTGWVTRNIFRNIFGNEITGDTDTFLLKFK